MIKDFWASKKVLVTGANGFIGSWLTEALVNNGANVTAFVKKGDIIGTESIKHLKDKIRIIYGDIRDAKSVTNAVRGKDVIFHLAAITQVLYSIKNPKETIDINVCGTFNILEAIRRNNYEQFLVFTSTDKVYGEPKYNPIDEEHPLSSKSPYDASKLAADRLVHSYHVSYHLKSSIVRWSNTYGGRDSNILRAVPDFVVSLLNGRPPVIRGDGNHVRDYVYVDDAVSGILCTAEKQKISTGHTFNLGTERPVSVRELAKLIIKIFGLSGKIRPVVLRRNVPGEIRTQYLSAKKARKMLGWKPKTNLEEGLQKTISWYKNNPAWQKVVKRNSRFYAKTLKNAIV